MNLKIYYVLPVTICMINAHLYGQGEPNCFLYDYEPRTAVIPEAMDAEKPAEQASVKITLIGDTIGKVSRYVFGNAIAAWAGAHDNPELVEGIERLAPAHIRFPGGSWSNGYFWNGVPSDIPDSIYDGTTYNSTTQTATKNKFWGQTGSGGWQTTTDQYYALCKNTNVDEGLITINYGYARYGTSGDPVAQAAHLAADWVRYDAGRTKFWEIGNENAGPWEYGWMIDTALNKDGQPQIITGELYGKHFKVFVDSMKAAAAAIGTTIYIGGQIVVNGETSWNFVDRTWNEGFFKEASDAADFYVIHNYFGYSDHVKSILDIAATEPYNNMDFIKKDIVKKKAYPKPVALTEYNIGFGNDVTGTSYINGMQAVIIICELIKNNFGLAARWLLASGEGSMFYAGSDPNYLNHPHADFYYLTYLQRMIGDHAISTVSSNSDILAYASTYSSGETAIVIINTGTQQRIVTVSTDSIGVGEQYHIYSFTGGNDDEFSKVVYINENGPSSSYHWGPYDQLFDIKANGYSVGGEIKFTSPSRSVQMIMIENGTNHIIVDDTMLTEIHAAAANLFKLNQNYPNPVHSFTQISYELPERVFVTLKVYDYQGREVTTLVNNNQNAGLQSVELNASHLQSGLYYYSLKAGNYIKTKKLIILK
ncbi:MAG: T9SS type A sorting domain-containing protein [Bacteroidales bacterium]|nr:T9SS type A sorting domain-containing protein [Bacteroidales bacterium]